MKQAPLHSPSQNNQSGPFDVVALAGSAGGHAAITTVLRGLPAGFSVPVLVMMHLGAESTGTTEVIGRRLPFPVDWVCNLHQSDAAKHIIHSYMLSTITYENPCLQKL